MQAQPEVIIDMSKILFAQTWGFNPRIAKEFFGAQEADTPWNLFPSS